jgi:hypothetical protein
MDELRLYGTIMVAAGFAFEAAAQLHPIDISIDAKPQMNPWFRRC